MKRIACPSLVIRPFPIVALPWWRRASTSDRTLLVWPRGFAWVPSVNAPA